MGTTSNFGFPYPEDTDLVRDGAQAIESLADAVDSTVAAGFRYAGQIVYTTVGTTNFSKGDPLGTGDIGLRAVRVRCQGGGGAGGGSKETGANEGSAGGGGAGGVYAESFLNASSIASSVTVTVGGGGAKVSGDAGGDGGDSSFGSHVVASGGAGGITSINTTLLRSVIGAPESDSGTGQIVIGGSGGGGAIRGNPVPSMGGTGGSSHMGAGARGTGSHLLNSGSNGRDGKQYGGGGGGACAHQNNSARSGGAGAPGIVIIDLFV